MVNATRPYLRRAERLLQPRLQFMLSPLATRLTGLACVLLAILIALPIPFANFLSGLAIAAFALGLLRHDGIAVLFGWIVTGVSVGATVLVSGRCGFSRRTPGSGLRACSDRRAVCSYSSGSVVNISG
jgi:hypothetical protein